MNASIQLPWKFPPFVKENPGCWIVPIQNSSNKTLLKLCGKQVLMPTLDDDDLRLDAWWSSGVVIGYVTLIRMEVVNSNHVENCFRCF